MKKLLLLVLMVGLYVAASAQTYRPSTIREVQFRDSTDLANCVQVSPLVDSLVEIFGSVTMDGFIANPSGSDRRSSRPGNHHNVWLHAGSGEWSGLDLFHLNGETSAGPTGPVDMRDLQAGDSVRIVGRIDDFRDSETEIFPDSVFVIGQGSLPVATHIPVSDLNKLDTSGFVVNDVTTGERWEGVYVELTNLRVAAVGSATDGPTILLEDSVGNTVELFPRFFIMFTANGFVAPPIGTVYDTVRGVVAQGGSANGCIDPTDTDGAGYWVYPFKAEDLVLGAGQNIPPVVTEVKRSPAVISDSDDCAVTATATDSDGSIAMVELVYQVGSGNEATVMMTPITPGSDTYTGTIPSALYNDNELVTYYVRATDNLSATSSTPNVPDRDPNFFFVSNDGVSIEGVQRVPASFSRFNSSYAGLTVTLTGIVTASGQSNDLGTVFIQEPGKNEYAGLLIQSNPSLAALSRGDSVEVTGEIAESFGMTVMNVTTVSTLATGKPVPTAVEVAPEVFSSSDANAERYEAMLVSLVNETAGKGVYIGEQYPDSTNGNNFAEYIVTSNTLTPNMGARVQAGRQSNGNISSLFNGYLNDISWVTEGGAVTVPTCIVNQGDTATSITGIAYFSFGAFKVNPRTSDDYFQYNGANCPDGLAVVRVNNDLTQELGRIEVYPNPSTEVLHVAYDMTRAVNGVAELRDMLGRPVAQTAINGTKGVVTLRTDALTAGAYMLLIKNQDQLLKVEKILVK